MRRSVLLSLVSLAALAWVAPVQAEWGLHIRTRFADVQVGGPGQTQLPPPPGPGLLLPQPTPIPVPLAPPPVSTRPMTLQEFAAWFKPVPGTHEVVLLHTRSGCPVRVCFTLPPGCPVVHLRRHEIEFDYGKCEVEVRFQICSKVKVSYH